MPIVASVIDTTAEAAFGGNGMFQLTTPVWASGGNLYTIGMSTTSNYIGVWKSTDAGATWTEQDSANHPTDSSTCNDFLVGAVAYVLVGPRSDQGDVALRLYSFDCGTDNWTLIDGTGPAAHWATYISRLSTGDFVIAYGMDGANDLWLASFDGASWNNIQDLTIVTDPALRSFDAFGCLDQDDRTHLFFYNTAQTDFWHAAVDSSLALGTVDALPGLNRIGGAIAVGANVLLGVVESNDVKVVVGTPLAAPVFTVGGVVDSEDATTVNLAYDSGSSKLLCMSLSQDQERFTLSETLDLTGDTGWTSTVVYDTDVDTLPPDFLAIGVFPAGMWIGGGKLYLISNYQNTAVAAFISFYIGFFVISTPRRLRNTFE